jgi:hypothetical protein
MEQAICKRVATVKFWDGLSSGKDQRSLIFPGSSPATSPTMQE